MTTHDAIIFDLDGTLWDTGDACAVAWNRVLARHSIAFRTIVGDDVRRVAGLPHERCIRDTFVGLDERSLQQLIDDTADEDNAAIAAEGGTLYPGLHEGLARLGERHPLFIVSNCQAGYIDLFLNQTGLHALFRDVECWGNTGEAKPENLRRVIARNGLQRPVFVGDTEGDQRAAEACGTAFVHVAYGFGTCPSASVRAHSFEALVALLLAAQDLGQ